MKLSTQVESTWDVHTFLARNVASVASGRSSKNALRDLRKFCRSGILSAQALQVIQGQVAATSSTSDLTSLSISLFDQRGSGSIRICWRNRSKAVRQEQTLRSSCEHSGKGWEFPSSQIVTLRRSRPYGHWCLQRTSEPLVKSFDGGIGPSPNMLIFLWQPCARKGGHVTQVDTRISTAVITKYCRFCSVPTVLELAETFELMSIRRVIQHLFVSCLCTIQSFAGWPARGIEAYRQAKYEVQVLSESIVDRARVLWGKIFTLSYLSIDCTRSSHLRISFNVQLNLCGRTFPSSGFDVVPWSVCLPKRRVNCLCHVRQSNFARFCHGQAENLAQECLRGKLTSDLHEVFAAQWVRCVACFSWTRCPKANVASASKRGLMGSLLNGRLA